MAFVELRAYAELADFLPPAARGRTVRRPFRDHQTVKDVVEAAGIPHTEVDLLLVDGEPVGLEHRPPPGARVAAFPSFTELAGSPLAALRPPLTDPARFVVDVNLGRLARLLRLVGFDVRYDRLLDDAELAALAAAEARVLLTRDRRLLTRRNVVHGGYVRADRPDDQIVEVLRRFDLGARLAPFTRCLRCGGVLTATPKVDVLEQLQPLTRRHYDEFARCTRCAQVYWPGSHHRRLGALVDEVVARLTPR